MRVLRLQQLREDLEFAILRAERLAALDALDSPPSPRHPLEMKALADVFAVFGYAPDDLIDKHDQCAIFRRVRAELEDALRTLAANPKKYDKAVVLRDRLRRMKTEFVDMQRSYEARRQQQERERLAKGGALCAIKSDAHCEARVDQTEREIADKRADLDKTHAVQRAQLEEFLERLQEPPAKLSKLLLQLKSTEKSLSKLRLFEDARTVFLRADALEKDERARSACSFEQFKQQKREQLRAQQAGERAEMDEKLAERRYITRRRNDAHRSTYVLVLSGHNGCVANVELVQRGPARLSAWPTSDSICGTRTRSTCTPSASSRRTRRARACGARTARRPAHSAASSC